MQQYSIDPVRFGTDGWRAIIDADFNPANVARVAEAAAKVFRESNPAADDNSPNTIIIGYDTRREAGRYAALVGTIVAASGFDIILSSTYCPTPTLCWSVANNPEAIGGIMLTSSHNPAEYLGIKLRMQDGGASPKSFTDRVEAAMRDELPERYQSALDVFAQAVNGTMDQPATPLPQAPWLAIRDLMTPYLDTLIGLVDAQAIRAAGLRVVVDPLYGAGRVYLAATLRRLGVTVEEVNNATDPTFNGLHPEPIPPWIATGEKRVVELGYDACFVVDGDADRIGAIDAAGTFVNPHRVLALIIAHLVEDKHLTGRVVRTLSGSNLLKRQCDRLGLPLTTTPIGFKWIYGEMLQGDVLIGGEESGGIGIPTHVRERDGLLMSLLLTELMAQKRLTLKQLVDDMLQQLGNLDYNRRDLRITPQQKQSFLKNHVESRRDPGAYSSLFSPLGEVVEGVCYEDGIKFGFASDAWLLMRPSGTEPLVRVYAEAATPAQVEALLDAGCNIVEN